MDENKKFEPIKSTNTITDSSNVSVDATGNSERKTRSPRLNLSALRQLDKVQEKPTEPIIDEIEHSIGALYDEKDKTLEIQPIIIEDESTTQPPVVEDLSKEEPTVVDVMDCSDAITSSNIEPLNNRMTEDIQVAYDEPTPLHQEVEEIPMAEEVKTFDPSQFKKTSTPLEEDFITDYEQEATVSTNKTKKKKHFGWLKGIFIFLLIIAFFLTCTIGTYVFYLQYTYNPSTELEEIDIGRNKTWYVKAGKEYTMMTYDIGFGNNVPEYASYIDGGDMVMLNDETVLRNNMDHIIELLKKENCDFYLLQEVDTASTRSYMIDQNEEISTALTRYSKTHIEDKHTRYLFWPYKNQIGVTTSGTDFYSLYHMSYSYRKPLPSTTNFMKKFEDYDRCVSIQYLSMSNTDAYLVVINVNLYGSDEAKLSNEQWKVLYEIMEDEYNDGNYVILGGVFNKNLTNDVYSSTQKGPSWIANLTNSDLPEHFSVVYPKNSGSVSTYYYANDPYMTGHNYESALDGFIVSDNIKADAMVIDTNFEYSNHNPVKLTFTLQKPSKK